MRKLPLFIASFAVCANASAGGWTSGGGELLESSPNPWFIQAGGAAAKRVVRYCVEADEANFGVALADLEKQVEAEFRVWRDDFESAVTPDNGVGNRVHVATESFFIEPSGCKSTTPIRFQFGILTDEQLRQFKDHGQDPTHLVAVAVRTDYDEAQLNSRGFVYVSPPRGPLAMQARDVIADPWVDSAGMRLQAVLRHELGHLFGLQHSGTQNDLMGAGYPEYVVSNSPIYLWSLHSRFRVPLGVDLMQYCVPNFPAQMIRIFGIPPGYECVAPRIWHNKLEIVARRTRNTPPLVIGEAPFDPEVVRRTETLVRLWLPTAQQVFKNVPSYLGNILNGPTAERLQRTGTYTIAATGEQRELQIHLAPERIQIDGFWEGKLRLDLLPYISFP